MINRVVGEHVTRFAQPPDWDTTCSEKIESPAHMITRGADRDQVASAKAGEKALADNESHFRNLMTPH
jgi:hypothetical protein